MSNKGRYKSYSSSPYMKTAYRKDMVINAFDTPFRKKWTVVGIVLFLVFPFVIRDFSST